MVKKAIIVISPVKESFEKPNKEIEKVTVTEV